MVPYNLIDRYGAYSPEFARGYLWPPPGLRLLVLFLGFLIVGGGQERWIRLLPVVFDQ